MSVILQMDGKKIWRLQRHVNTAAPLDLGRVSLLLLLAPGETRHFAGLHQAVDVNHVMSLGGRNVHYHDFPFYSKQDLAFKQAEDIYTLVALLSQLLFLRM